MPQNRDKTGRLGKGQRGGKASRPKQLQKYAKQAPNNLRAIADDPDTPVKVKTEIEKWFYETVYGKATQGLELEGGSVEVRSLDLNKLSDEQLAAMLEEADE